MTDERKAKYAKRIASEAFPADYKYISDDGGDDSWVLTGKAKVLYGRVLEIIYEIVDETLEIDRQRLCQHKFVLPNIIGCDDKTRCVYCDIDIVLVEGAKLDQ